MCKINLSVEENWIETRGVRKAMTLDEVLDLRCVNCYEEDSFAWVTLLDEEIEVCENCLAEIIKGRAKINKAYIHETILDDDLEMYLGKIEITII